MPSHVCCSMVSAAKSAGCPNAKPGQEVAGHDLSSGWHYRGFWRQAISALEPLLHELPDIGGAERLAKVWHVSMVQKYSGF